ALAGGRRDVDVIDPDPGPGDGPELARVVEQLGGDLGGGPDDGGVGGAEGGLEVVALEAGAVVHLDPGFGEQGDPSGFELVGDENAGHRRPYLSGGGR